MENEETGARKKSDIRRPIKGGSALLNLPLIVGISSEEMDVIDGVKTPPPMTPASKKFNSS